MKKLILTSILSVTLPLLCPAQLLVGSGANIAANSTSNFTPVALVCTVTFAPQTVAFTAATNSITDSLLVGGYARFTFDGTNFLNLPGGQSFWWSNLIYNANNGTYVWITTNQTFGGYVALSITNGQATAVTNLTANH